MTACACRPPYPFSPPPAPARPPARPPPFSPGGKENNKDLSTANETVATGKKKGIGMFANKKRPAAVAAASSQPDGTAADDGAPTVRHDSGGNDNDAASVANLSQFDTGLVSDVNAGGDAPRTDATGASTGVPKDISAPRDDVHDDLTVDTNDVSLAGGQAASEPAADGAAAEEPRFVAIGAGEPSVAGTGAATSQYFAKQPAEVDGADLQKAGQQHPANGPPADGTQEPEIIIPGIPAAGKRIVSRAPETRATGVDGVVKTAFPASSAPANHGPPSRRVSTSPVPEKKRDEASPVAAPRTEKSGDAGAASANAEADAPALRNAHQGSLRQTTVNAAVQRNVTAVSANLNHGGIRQFGRALPHEGGRPTVPALSNRVQPPVQQKPGISARLLNNQGQRSGMAAADQTARDSASSFLPDGKVTFSASTKMGASSTQDSSSSLILPPPKKANTTPRSFAATDRAAGNSGGLTDPHGTARAAAKPAPKSASNVNIPSGVVRQQTSVTPTPHKPPAFEEAPAIEESMDLVVPGIQHHDDAMQVEPTKEQDTSLGAEMAQRRPRSQTIFSPPPHSAADGAGVSVAVAVAESTPKASNVNAAGAAFSENGNPSSFSVVAAFQTNESFQEIADDFVDNIQTIDDLRGMGENELLELEVQVSHAWKVVLGLKEDYCSLLDEIEGIQSTANWVMAAVSSE